LGLTGSKCDLFEKEKISEEEARKFANENDAVFKLTSAMSNLGIDELFEELALKYYENCENNNYKNNHLKSIIINRKNNIEEKKKKKFC